MKDFFRTFHQDRKGEISDLTRFKPTVIVSEGDKCLAWKACFDSTFSYQERKRRAQLRPGQILAQNVKVKMNDMDGLLEYL